MTQQSVVLGKAIDKEIVAIAGRSFGGLEYPLLITSFEAGVPPPPSSSLNTTHTIPSLHTSSHHKPSFHAFSSQYHHPIPNLHGFESRSWISCCSSGNNGIGGRGFGRDGGTGPGSRLDMVLVVGIVAVGIVVAMVLVEVVGKGKETVSLATFEMETLYSKLYNKYSKLKKEKDMEMENLNRDQEKKFMNFVEASDEMIEFLRSENERLHNQVSELRSEIALVRSTKDEECIQYNRLLMAENQNNKKLSEEIERLHNLQREGRCCQASDEKVGEGPVDMPESSQVESYSSDVICTKKMRKRSRRSLNGSEDRLTPSATKEHEHVQLNRSADESCRETEANAAPPTYYQPASCKRKMNRSGIDVAANCMFQDLVEWVIGLKLSIIAQNEEFCVSALHPASGYSFSLTRVNNSNGEPELLYRALSLGTFERVAPEWMRDVLIFSTSMCPTFFQRVSRIIKLNH
ncbi:hypothetical protein ACH5RR_003219 [Cinchona calisaya]|uniref:DUF7806 domain-containing protein n=1 Tax=Cinchona calisaya TaxID=153742 RepID=A0ABD3AU69_9GENT